MRTKKTSGKKTQATTTGNNYAPRLSFDGSKVVFLSDRSGVKASYWQAVDGSKTGGAIEHPVNPYATLLTGLGDSIMATGWINGVASFFGVTLSTPASVNSTAGGATAGGGIGSQRSEQIGPRYGAAGLGGAPALTCSLSGNTMATGANQLTALSIPILSRASDSAGAIRTLRASILGVSGVLQSVQKASADGTTIPPSLGVDNYTYTFTPDVGQILPGSVPAGTVLTIDPENRQDTPLILHIGRNNVGSGAGWQAIVKTWVAAVVAAYKPFTQKIMVIGVTNARSEPSGSQNYTDIVALNAELAALYPDYFFDVRPYFNTGEPTDIPSSAYTDDGLHPNSSGQLNGFTIPVRTEIAARGWFS